MFGENQKQKYPHCFFFGGAFCSVVVPSGLKIKAFFLILAASVTNSTFADLVGYNTQNPATASGVGAVVFRLSLPGLDSPSIPNLFLPNWVRRFTRLSRL